MGEPVWPAAGPAVSGDDEARADHADATAQRLQRRARRHPLGRRWSRNASGPGQRRGAVLRNMLVGLTTWVLAGQPPSHEADQAAAAVLGLTSEEADDYTDAVSELSIDALLEAAGNVTGEEILRARDYLLARLPASNGEEQPNYSAAAIALLAVVVLDRAGQISPPLKKAPNSELFSTPARTGPR